jgi:cyanophycinase
MTRRRLLALSVLLISAIAFAPRAATLTAAPWPSAAKAAAPEYGPPSGTLFIGGGGGLSITLIDKFIELGGGVDGRFVIVPTGGGNLDGTGAVRVYVESQVVSFWRTRGLKNVKMLHTHDPKIADTVEFAKVLSDATAVWFNGGRHHHIVDSYAGTLTYKEFHKVLERGGVIGGSSAGATIQGDYLVRGDSRTNTIVMTDEPNHQKGFEFLRRSAIDQHIDTRNRWDDLIPVIKRYPNLLGIGLSEDTAIVVKGDQLEVMGKSKVAIHDNTRKYHLWEKPYYLLGAGDVYMKTRQVTRRRRPESARGDRTASIRRGAGVPADQTRSSAATAPPAEAARLAEPSGTTVGPGNGRSAVPAPIPIKLPRLLEHLLMIAGADESWWQIEVIDVDADGEVDLLRIHLVNINGEDGLGNRARKRRELTTSLIAARDQELPRPARGAAARSGAHETTPAPDLAR